ncbi:MAG: hypothetical protein ACK52I_36745 [Pseudomonadota bacterium]|jgi:hypothetical protein
MSDITGITRDALVATLPLTFGQRLLAFDSASTDINVVGALLVASPTSSIALKGPGRWTTALWDGVKAEARKFLCTESEEYADLRSEWAGLKEKGSGLAVSALSGAIGAKLGVAAGVLSPMVIWILLVGLRVGKNGLCTALSSGSAPTLPSG